MPVFRKYFSMLTLLPLGMKAVASIAMASWLNGAGLALFTAMTSFTSTQAYGQAQPETDNELAHLTWTEIRSRVKSGTETIIIPVGGTEQSGPFIAVGKHNKRAQSLADRIASQVGKTLVAPVIAYVPEGHIFPPTSHMRFAGTISIPHNVFKALLLSAAESFEAHGFKLVVFIGDHGGYQSDLKEVAHTLNEKWKGKGSHALFVEEYYTTLSTQFVPYLQHHGLGEAVGKHADISDTSLMLAIDPSMVRLQQLHAAPLPNATEGIYGGDPRKASAALGQIGIGMQIQAAVSAIHRAQSSLSNQ